MPKTTPRAKERTCLLALAKTLHTQVSYWIERQDVASQEQEEADDVRNLVEDQLTRIRKAIDDYREARS